MLVLRCMEGRCGLCRFRFVEGDDVVAVKRSDSDTPLKYTPKGFEDERGAQLYHDCPVPCVHNLDQATGCHPSCLDFLPPALLPWYLEMSAYSFEPLPYQERARCLWLEDRLAFILAESIPLPTELRREIARYLPQQEYAVIANQSLLSRPKDIVFDVSDIHLLKKHYVEFEGGRYLSAMSLKDDSEQSSLATPATPKVIYVSEDHRGIRELVFSQSGLAPEVDCVPGIWWKVLHLPNLSGTISFHNDSVKIRHLTYYDGQKSYTTHNASCFDDPQLSGKSFRRHPFHAVNPSLPPRISRLQYNMPGMTGISICCSPVPSILHTHTPSSDLSFYESAPDNSIWCYLPLGEGEHIKEVWMRKSHILGHESGLTFVTTSHSTIEVGPYITTRFVCDDWTLQDAPDGKPSNMYLDSQPSCIKDLLFDSEVPEHQPRLIRPKPLSRAAYFENSNHIYWSSASVDDVVKLNICRRPYQDSSVVIGLLLEYSDGTKASLGQIRLDYLDPPVPVSSSQNLYLDITTANGGGWHIINAYMASSREIAENSEDSNMCFKVDWSGTLEWWFTYRYCRLWQNGRQSLEGYWRA